MIFHNPDLAITEYLTCVLPWPNSAQDSQACDTIRLRNHFGPLYLELKEIQYSCANVHGRLKHERIVSSFSSSFKHLQESAGFSDLVSFDTIKKSRNPKPALQTSLLELRHSNLNKYSQSCRNNRPCVQSTLLWSEVVADRGSSQLICLVLCPCSDREHAVCQRYAFGCRLTEHAGSMKTNKECRSIENPILVAVCDVRWKAYLVGRLRMD